MKLKNNIFIIDAPDYHYPYTEYLCQNLNQKKIKVFFFTRLNSRFNLDTVLSKKFFYFFSDYFRVKNKLLIGLEHLFGMILLIFNFISYKPKNVIFQTTPIPLVDIIFILIIKKFTKLTFVMHNSNQLHGDVSYFQILGYKNFIKHFDKIICHSKKTKKNLISKHYFDKKQILFYEIPLYSKTRKFIKKKEDIKEFNILFFGLIREYKGLDILLKALANIRQKKIKLTIAGKPMINLKRYIEIINRYNIRDKINWDLGYKSDYEISKLFNSTKLVALPYRDIDASGIVNLCFTFQTPVILSDLESFRDDYKKTSGVVFAKKNDHRDFSKKILYLFNSIKVYRDMYNKIKIKSRSINTWQEVGSKIRYFLELE